MEGYSDNYPYNIESPQKLYIQYSHDIDWDYSTGQYPDGTEDDWHWESKYIPISHSINGLEVGRHEWMRIKVGTLNTWTYPIRISANVTNISAISSEIIDEGDTYTEFSIILHFEDGSTVESESIRIRNGEDGLGIASCEVREDGYLYITYTDNTIVNAGRTRGQDAEGLPSMADDDYLLSQSAGVAVWISPLQAINNALLVTLPIEYDFLTGTISHNLDNGNKHIPIGGSSGFILSTDGSGNYTWIDPTDFSHNSLNDVDLATTGITYGHIDDSTQTIYGNKTFDGNLQIDGQAHGGSYQATWSSGVIFSANNGNIQEVIATNSGTVALSNDLPGTYIFRVEIDTVSGPTITMDSSLGTELTNSSLPFDNSDNAVNIITVVKFNSGAKSYTISN